MQIYRFNTISKKIPADFFKNYGNIYHLTMLSVQFGAVSTLTSLCHLRRLQSSHPLKLKSIPVKR